MLLVYYCCRIRHDPVYAADFTMGVTDAPLISQASGSATRSFFIFPVGFAAF